MSRMLPNSLGNPKGKETTQKWWAPNKTHPHTLTYTRHTHTHHTHQPTPPHPPHTLPPTPHPPTRPLTHTHTLGKLQRPRRFVQRNIPQISPRRAGQLALPAVLCHRRTSGWLISQGQIQMEPKEIHLCCLGVLDPFLPVCMMMQWFPRES